MFNLVFGDPVKETLTKTKVAKNVVITGKK